MTVVHDDKLFAELARQRLLLNADLPADAAFIAALEAVLDGRYGQDVPTAWTAVTFANSWVNFDASHPTQYRKVGDEVAVRGVIKSGTISVAAFTLPVGFRPFQEETFVVLSNGVLGYVTVNTSGTVVPNGSNTYVYLSGIRFSTVA